MWKEKKGKKDLIIYKDINRKDVYLRMDLDFSVAGKHNQVLRVCAPVGCVEKRKEKGKGKKLAQTAVLIYTYICVCVCVCVCVCGLQEGG